MTKTNQNQDSRKRAKRNEILAIATDIFLIEGYGRASMEKVHSRLGGSKRTLYNHFSSKEVLFEAIVTSVSDKALVALKQPRAEDNLRGALNCMGTDYLSVLLSRDGLALYRTMASEAKHFPELAKGFFLNGPARASRHLADFFREQVVKGTLDVEDPQAAAEQFLGAVRGDLHLAAIFESNVPSKKVVDSTVASAVDIFLCGVSAKGAAK